MDMKQTGRLIAALRKERGLTQKALAAHLHVTDKAVSKWERGLSCPDVSLLTPLSALLGISVPELLRGERKSAAVPDAVQSVGAALEYAETSNAERGLRLRRLAGYCMSGALLLACVICFICDGAAAAGLTWSLYPFSACVFVWAVVFPLLMLRRNVLVTALCIFSLLLIPFLAVLHILTGRHPQFLPIAVPVSGIAIAYLWAVYWLFRRFRRYFAAGAACGMLLPACLLINLVIAHVLAESVLNVWDLLSGILLLLISIHFFMLDRNS